MALEIASRFNWHGEIFWNHYSLAHLFCDEGEFDDAHAHVGRAGSHIVHDAHKSGCVMEMHARIFIQQGRLEDAEVEVLGTLGVYDTLGVYEELGATRDAEDCRNLLRSLERCKADLPAQGF